MAKVGFDKSGSVYEPVSREDLLMAAEEAIKGFNLGEALEHDAIDATKQVLSHLPDEVKSMQMLARRCLRPTSQVSNELKAKYGIDVSEQRQFICAQIKLTLVRKRFDEFTELLMQHSYKNSPPKRKKEDTWLFGSLFHLKPWEYPSLAQWMRDTFGDEMAQEIFDREVLPKLSEEWIKSYLHRPVRKTVDLSQTGFEE